MHALGVEVEFAGRPTGVFAVYGPPQNPLRTADVRRLLRAAHPIVAAGDWNAKHTDWHSQTCNPRGRRLLADSVALGYSISAPDSPTHYPDGRGVPDILDLAVHKGIDALISQEVVVDEFGSDHLPVVMHLIDAAPAPPIPREVRRVDWRAFQTALNSATQLSTPETPAAVDEAAGLFTAQLQRALSDATSARPAPAVYPALPNRLLALIRRKRSLRRQWQQTRCPRLKAELRRLAESVKSGLEVHAAESWEFDIGDATADWAALHRLCRRFTNTAPPVHPLRDDAGVLHYAAADRAELLATHLATQFSPHPAANPARVAEVERAVAEYIAAPIPPGEDAIFFSPALVRKSAQRLKPRKAPGADGITNAVLRRLPLRALVSLTRLFNGAARTAHFPAPWKEARVITIPKPGKDVLRAASYRPISLLSTQSKLFESLLLPRLNRCAEPRPEQFGFRPGHSTTLQLARVLHAAATAVNKKEVLAAVFLDMEKAFDRVWHAGLVSRLIELRFPRRVVALVHSFLLDRRFHVAVGGAYSSPRAITAGVPQGGVLSPALYTIFTDDVPAAPGSMVALYADDTAYLASSIRAAHAAAKLQRSLDLLPAWLEERRLVANAAKSQAILFGAGRLPPALHLQDADIPWRPEVTYLGVVLDRRLKLRHHAVRAAGRAAAAASKLRPLLSSRLPTRAKLALYRQYIRPHLTYAAPAWYGLTAEYVRQRLRAVQNKTLRRIVDAPRFVRNATIARDLRQESLDDFIKRLATQMFARADASSFAHLRDIAPHHSRPPDHRRAFPRELVRQGPPPD
ncbi:unnamed protein product [Leptosia nina]|uniref:Reverse transcriptase domain-containing protein n=1 Tax=Leptosia nina TaxID=320188 RepID=A0AAV1IW95_9NEOP